MVEMFVRSIVKLTSTVDDTIGTGDKEFADATPSRLTLISKLTEDKFGHRAWAYVPCGPTYFWKTYVLPEQLRSGIGMATSKTRRITKSYHFGVLLRDGQVR
jgi:hypothetical protein